MKIYFLSIATLLLASFVSFNQLTLNIATKTTNPGGTVCVDVTSQSFQQIMSMQYTVKWNPKVLQFTEVKGFTLPGMTPDSFGKRQVTEGILPVSWYDQNLRSVSLPDGSSLYQICYNVIGTSGEKSFIQFTEVPTTIEISDVQGNILELNGQAGMVKIR